MIRISPDDASAGIMPEDQTRGSEPPEHEGITDCCESKPLVGLCIRTVIEQELLDGVVAPERNAAKRSLAAIVACIVVGPSIQQDGRSRGMSVIGGQHQQRMAFVVAEHEKTA
jgi:hypothetical protein